MINSVRGDILVDSGSPVTLISYEYFESLGDRKPGLRSVETTLTSAGGNSLEVIGKSEFRIKLGKHTYNHEILVVKLGSDRLRGILGMDFLSQKSAVLFSKSRKLKIGKDSVRPNPDKSRVYSCARIRVAEPVSIPPNSEMFILGYIDGEYRDDKGLLETSKVVKNKELLMCKSIVKPQNKTVFVSVANVNNRLIKLDRDTIIASLQSFDSSVPFEYNVPDTKDSHSELPGHLLDMLDKSSEKLTDVQKAAVFGLVSEFRDNFVGPGEQLGRTNLVEHQVDTGNSEPFKPPLRRVPIMQREILEREIENMLQNDIIEPSDSPYASPVCLVKKKDGSVRFCIDYRRLNSQTKKDAFPLLRIDESLESLTGARWFST